MNLMGGPKEEVIINLNIDQKYSNELFFCYVAEPRKDCQFELPPESRSAKLWQIFVQIDENKIRH